MLGGISHAVSANKLTFFHASDWLLCIAGLLSLKLNLYAANTIAADIHSIRIKLYDFELDVASADLMFGVMLWVGTALIFALIILKVAMNVYKSYQEARKVKIENDKAEGG